MGKTARTDQRPLLLCLMRLRRHNNVKAESDGLKRELAVDSEQAREAKSMEPLSKSQEKSARSQTRPVPVEREECEEEQRAVCQWGERSAGGADSMVPEGQMDWAGVHSGTGREQREEEPEDELEGQRLPGSSGSCRRQQQQQSRRQQRLWSSQESFREVEQMLSSS